jgi:hypothetical protein
MRERRYSSYSLLTSALDGVSDQSHAQAALYPRGKDPPVPIVQDGPQSRSGHRGKILLPLLRIERRSLSHPIRSQRIY